MPQHIFMPQTYLQASTYLHASTLQAQMYCLTECNSSPTLSLLSPPLHTAQGRMSDCRASPRNIHNVDTTSFCDNFVSTLMSSKNNNVKFRYSIMCKQDEAFKVPSFPFCTPHISHHNLSTTPPKCPCIYVKKAFKKLHLSFTLKKLH